MTPTEATLWPLIAHVLLVFMLYALLSRRRFAAVRAGRAKASAFRENRSEPDGSLTARNCLANQFELPVLFYAVSILLYLVDADNLVTVALGWFFVVSRYAHAYVHVTTNRLRYRRPAFVAGFAALGLLWVWLAVWLAFT
ncbi:MAPEG family protein [Rhizobium sp. TRM95111]|uniref:MAPEG family protein n=1 Tax=Rhizobium alarense TaxID=2846851 RepID=UPI001F3388E5|nr:MAPEG family protein [Rhizobium alarense]MCF3642512.1 MAPEG family protein [Rhizobium alarense]